VFPASEVEIVDNWNVVGMQGTGSHDLRLKDIRSRHRMAARSALRPVPSARSLMQRAARAYLPH